MDLRETIGRLTTHRCTWTAEEVAALAEVSLCGVRKYLTALTRQKVLTLTGDQYSAGPQARAWRNQPRKAKGPSSYGNSAKYRATRALWDSLRQRDWQAGKAGVVLTSRDESPEDNRGQQESDMDKTAKSSTAYTLTQVADSLSVSLKTIRREIERGKLRPFRVGRLVRVDQAEVDRYRTSQLTAAEA